MLSYLVTEHDIATAIRYCADQTPEVVCGHVARADKSQDHSRALQACISPAPKELEAASRSSKTYLAKDGGGRSAPV